MENLRKRKEEEEQRKLQQQRQQQQQQDRQDRQQAAPDDGDADGLQRRLKRIKKDHSQVEILEEAFKNNPLPSKKMKEKLALEAGLTSRAVQVRTLRFIIACLAHICDHFSFIMLCEMLLECNMLLP